MTPSKRDMLLNGQSSLGQKVYECVPILEPWAASQIQNQMAGNYDAGRIIGVLKDLKSQGLIKEVSRLRFIREEVKETLASKLEDAIGRAETQKSKHQPPEQERSEQMTPAEDGPFGRMAALAHDMRKCADEHRASMGAFCDELESIALDIQSQQEVNADQVASVRKLRDALKALEGI